MSRLRRGQTEHAVLARPFGREFTKSRDTHSIRQAPLNRRLDEVGCKEGKRDRHVDLAQTAAFSLSDRLTVVVAGSAISAFSHRRPLAIEAMRSARFSDRIGRAG